MNRALAELQRQGIPQADLSVLVHDQQVFDASELSIDETDGREGVVDGALLGALGGVLASTLVSAIRPKRGSRHFVGGGRMPPPACASAPPLPAPDGRARLRRDSHLDAMLVLDRLAESWVKSGVLTMGFITPPVGLVGAGALAMAAMRAVAGGALGALGAGLTGLGLPDRGIEQLLARLHDGQVLVTVTAAHRDEQLSVKPIFREHGAEEVRKHTVQPLRPPPRPPPRLSAGRRPAPRPPPAPPWPGSGSR